MAQDDNSFTGRRADSGPGEVPAQGNISILIVEDSKIQAESLRRILLREGYGVTIADNGVEGFAKAREMKPDIIITDILMPEMDGYELCRRIKDEKGLQDIPVIILTSLSEPDNIMRGLECGADNFLTKPYKEEFVLSRIKYIIANQFMRTLTHMDMGFEIVFGGKKYYITSNRFQIVDLLLSSFETAVHKSCELEKRNLELTSLCELSMAISLTTDLNELFRKAFAALTCSDVLNLIHRCAVFLVKNGGLKLCYHTGMDAPTCMRNGKLLAKAGECLCGLAARTGELVVCANSADDSRHTFSDPDMAQHGHFIVPLRANDKIVGVLCLYTLRGCQPDEHTTAMLLSAGNQIGMAISNIRAAQKERERKEKLASIGLMAGSVGHELRNPLAVMSNAVYFLQSVVPETDIQIREYLGIVKQEIGTSQRIITDLLDFSRTKDPEARAVPIHGLIRESMERCSIPENIRLDFTPAGMLPDVMADPQQMRQVFLNLITNAVQAMPEGGTLHITARTASRTWSEKQSMGKEEQDIREERRASDHIPDADFVEISIEDTGAGITPENMDLLFQPLFTTKTKGIGLGLAICKNLTEANGGRIGVESQLGKGTIFTVALPVAESSLNA